MHWMLNLGDRPSSASPVVLSNRLSVAGVAIVSNPPAHPLSLPAAESQPVRSNVMAMRAYPV